MRLHILFNINRETLAVLDKKPILFTFAKQT